MLLDPVMRLIHTGHVLREFDVAIMHRPPSLRNSGALATFYGCMWSSRLTRNERGEQRNLTINSPKSYNRGTTYLVLNLLNSTHTRKPPLFASVDRQN